MAGGGPATPGAAASTCSHVHHTPCSSPSPVFLSSRAPPLFSPNPSSLLPKPSIATVLALLPYFLIGASRPLHVRRRPNFTVNSFCLEPISNKPSTPALAKFRQRTSRQILVSIKYSVASILLSPAPDRFTWTSGRDKPAARKKQEKKNIQTGPTCHSHEFARLITCSPWMLINLNLKFPNILAAPVIDRTMRQH